MELYQIRSYISANGKPNEGREICTLGLFHLAIYSAISSLFSSLEFKYKYKYISRVEKIVKMQLCETDFIA